MLRSVPATRPIGPPCWRRLAKFRAAAACFAIFLLVALSRGNAAILWSDLGSTLVHDTGAGSSFLTGSAMDILGGAVKADDSSSNVLYFKFRVDPLSDVSTEKYFAGFQFYEGDADRLAIGNSWEAYAYSAFNTSETGESNKIAGDFDFHSSRREPSGLGSFFPYEIPRRGIECTIIFKVEYVPHGDDLVTVWLNPDLSSGATEDSQPRNLTTQFRANASFDQIRLRHGGGGNGWTFSEMAIATEFDDFVRGNNLEPGEGAGRGLRSLTFQSWQREQGLPQNSVRALAQTRDGYLWVGSDGGLARFDGLRFVPFDMREGMRSEPVSVLMEDSRGTFWIGTVGGGLTCLQDGRFTTFTTANGLPADSITALAEDSTGRLWVGTDLGLAILEKGTFIALNGADDFKGRTITTLFKDNRGSLWLGASGVGVFQFVSGQFHPLPDSSPEGLLRDPHCLLVDKSGRIWVGAGDDYVLCHEADQWRRYRIPRHLARPYVNAFVEEPDGSVWAGSVSEGLFQFAGGKVTVVNASAGLLDNFVESLLVDHEGNLWVGTAAGLNRIRRSNLSVLGTSEGLGYGAVQGLAEVEPGQIWAGKSSDGLFRWDGKRFERLSAPESPQRYLGINALLRTRDKNLLVATAHGLLQFKDSQNTINDSHSALEKESIISLTEDRGGVVWAGSREGALWRKGPAGWRAQTNFVSNRPITAMAADPDGSVWVGTEGGGLFRFKDSVLAHFDKGNGLLSSLIRSLYLDAKHDLWIGTAGGGLSRWHEGHISADSFTTREGLPDNTISQILEDGSGRLWLGSNRGIACLNKSEVTDLTEGKLSAVYPRVYGRAEGMLSEECTGGFSPAGLKTRSGMLWFSTLKGIVVVDPRPQAANASAPRVIIEEVLVDGLAISDLSSLQSGGQNAGQPETLRLPPGRHRVEWHFTGLSFSAPERIRFRYRLEGLDSDWVEAGTRRTAFYSYVPPGNYGFHVSACNSDGMWNETGTSFTLVVMPHLWQSWWFIGSTVLGLLIAVGSAVRVAEKRKMNERFKRLEQERALERERSRIAQDLHDDLGSSLARISLLSGLVKADKENPAQVETHAGKISQSADQTVRALEEIVWAVRPGSDTLQSLVEYIAHFASELFDGNRTRCRLDLPHDLPALSLPPDVRHNIFLIVKEALTNALKHSAANEVRVQAKAAGTTVEIIVDDDGKGFDSTGSPALEKRNGLGNMRTRADAIGGQLEWVSTPGRGTNVRLVVDLANGRSARKN
jgi:ligand-binding sensor domain-containing protein/signal transduction histidine kinase